MDLISRENLQKSIEKALDNANLSEYEACVCVCEIYDKEIENAPTIEPQLSDEQIEKIADLLENEWGYEGMKEDVERILRGEIK